MATDGSRRFADAAASRLSRASSCAANVDGRHYMRQAKQLAAALRASQASERELKARLERLERAGPTARVTTSVDYCANCVDC